MKSIWLLPLFVIAAFRTYGGDWFMLFPKSVLTGDIQQFNIGTRNGGSTDPTFLVSNNEAANPNLPIQFFINGQPNRPDQLDPFGAVLSGTFYDRYSRQMIRKFFYEAPTKMPDQNPVEVKTIISPAGGAPITVTVMVIVLAENWTFKHFFGLHYRCFDGGSSNPKNVFFPDMGMVTEMHQTFHFTANTLNFLTGEATAIMDGEPVITYSKTYQGGACSPTDYTAKLLWGNDDQTLIKNVKVRFTGSRMVVDYQTDYMNWLGWTIVQNATGAVIFQQDRKPGKHDAPAHVESPLQRTFVSKGNTPTEQQISLHSAGGVALIATN